MFLIDIQSNTCDISTHCTPLNYTFANILGQPQRFRLIMSSSSIMSSLRRLRRSVTVNPAAENCLSEAADETWTASKRCAYSASSGNSLSCAHHHASGSLVADAGSSIHIATSSLVCALLSAPASPANLLTPAFR